MMLSAKPFYQHSLYAPSRPSPLAERRANDPPPGFVFTMASHAQDENRPVPQRAHKPNPVIQNRDGATQRRRDLFFRRVQKERDDKKWESRGEQILRLDYESDRKRWAAEKARQAPELKIDEVLVDNSAEAFSSSYIGNNAPEPERDMTEAEYILAREEQELQALVAAMEEAEESKDTESQHYGSDDDDYYDQIFRECTNDTADMQQSSTHTQPSLGDPFGYPDEMDMT